jgi:hypothetical protein
VKFRTVLKSLLIQPGGVTARLYLEQKKFIEENKCQEGVVKKNTEAKKKSNGK